MTRYLLLLLLFICCRGLAQEHRLVAMRGNKTLVYSNGAAVRLQYQSRDTVLQRKGRLYIQPGHLELRSFGQRDTAVLLFQPEQIAGVRRIRRKLKLITGIAALGMLGLGASAIIEDQRERGELFDGLGTAVGIAGILAGALPYTIAVSMDRSALALDGYRYRIVPKNQ
ncbi:MAG TPA: hypothetical protein VHK69_07025 [Chitinophagaceae bacterium]|jgi:hypothetical protein|nr:hypothetical protein [Chitinophagaceae bacterium]